MYPPFLGSKIKYDPLYRSPTNPAYTTVSDDGSLVQPPNVCKEFVLDDVNYAVTGHLNDYVANIITSKPSLNEFRLFASANSNLIKNGLALVNQFEDTLKMPRSVVNTVEGGVVFRASPRWMIAPPMVSLYTTLVRMGSRYDNLVKLFDDAWALEYNVGDLGNINKAKLPIQAMLKFGEEKLFGKNITDNWPNSNQYIHWWGIASFGSDEIRKFYSLGNEQMLTRWYAYLTF